MSRAEANAVGPGGYGDEGKARAWGGVTVVVAIALALGVLLLGAYALSLTEYAPPVLQRLVQRGPEDPRSPINTDQERPAPFPPGNVTGRSGGTSGQVGGQSNLPGDDRGGSNSGTSLGGPTGAGPAGTRP